ncbi:P-loop containing nucleoside triphosphate hydrolase protein [Pelagophyceae sp. CCMP2097]|nr:P-loop containing nucleoside triphosphate hydrolase protein [Pelagophyceae sp. CCMP2097]
MVAVARVAALCLLASASAFAPARLGAVHSKAVSVDGQAQRRTKALSAVDIQFGDTSGAALVVEDVSVRRGAVELLTGVTWRVMPGERWGIVGPNGAGKSTLLGAILGLYATAQGRVSVNTGAQVGYLEQTGVGGSDSTVRSEVMSRMGPLAAAQKALEDATAVVEGGDYSEKALEDLAETQTAFEDAGGYTAEETVSKVLSGLGFDVSRDLDRPCSDFSGGWQMRIALARLLLSGPDLLLLDEPTNHLDAAARSWLAGYLAQYDGTLVLVSHDTAMLKRVCDSIAEVVGEPPNADAKIQIGRRLELYKSCSFEKWRSERTERASRWVNTWETQVAECADLEDFIRRFGAKASKASQAKDRERKLERLRATMLPQPPEEIRALAARVVEERDRLKKVKDNRVDDSNPLGDQEAAGSPLLSSKANAKLKLPAPPNCGVNALSLKNADVGYTSGKPIVRGVDLDVVKGMRVIVRGANGAGKSTLVKALAGAVPLLGGERLPDAKLKLGHFTQDLSQELDQEATALELVLLKARSDGDSETSEERGREVLGALGLRGPMAMRKIGTLSGGEKARVALAIFVLTPCNVLILDEPSNHLDVDTVSALAAALNAYEGAIVVVSHDRAFVEELSPTHVLSVGSGTALLENRQLADSDWAVAGVAAQADTVTDAALHDSRSTHDVAAEAAVEAAASADAAASSADTEEKRKLLFNRPKLLLKLESKIAAAEKDLEELDALLEKSGGDITECLKLVEKRGPLQSKVDGMFAEYEALEQLS